MHPKILCTAEQVIPSCFCQDTLLNYPYYKPTPIHYPGSQCQRSNDLNCQKSNDLNCQVGGGEVMEELTFTCSLYLISVLPITTLTESQPGQGRMPSCCFQWLLTYSMLTQTPFHDIILLLTIFWILLLFNCHRIVELYF